MGLLYTSAEIAEHALRQIGSFSPYDTSPDPASFAIALQRLELIVSEMVGTKDLWFFVPANQTIELEDNETEYDLDQLLEDNLQFVQQVFLVRDGRKTPLTQVRHDDFDAWEDDTVSGGNPENVFIERNDSPKLFLDHNPTDGDTLLIAGQKYSDVLTANKGNTPHGFPAAWQRGLIFKLASDIGSGPVTTLPDNEISRLEKRAEKCFFELEQTNNREQVRRPRFVANEEF